MVIHFNALESEPDTRINGQSFNSQLSYDQESDSVALG